MEKIPNVKVWLLGKEYLEAAESLEEEIKLWSAAILAALSIEIFLKSFLAKEDKYGFPSTSRGHPLVDLFAKISAADQADVLSASNEFNPLVDLNNSFQKFNDIFVSARYRYEEESIKSVGNDIVHFARHLCETIFLLGKKRGV